MAHSSTGNPGSDAAPKKTATKPTATSPAKSAAKSAAKAPAKAAARAAAKKPASDRSGAKAKKPGATKATPEKKAPRPASRQATAKSTAQAVAKKEAARTRAAQRSTSTSARRLAVKSGEDAWTKGELAEVLAELVEQREHSIELVVEQEVELSGLLRDSGDGAGQDQADVGATTFERDHELTVLTSERDKLAQIDRALRRIEDGTYGACESCGQPIGKMRLMAFPRATLCLTCKQREERR